MGLCASPCVIALGLCALLGAPVHSVSRTIGTQDTAIRLYTCRTRPQCILGYLCPCCCRLKEDHAVYEVTTRTSGQLDALGHWLHTANAVVGKFCRLFVNARAGGVPALHRVPLERYAWCKISGITVETTTES